MSASVSLRYWVLGAARLRKEYTTLIAPPAFLTAFVGRKAVDPEQARDKFPEILDLLVSHHPEAFAPAQAADVESKMVRTGSRIKTPVGLSRL